MLKTPQSTSSLEPVAGSATHWLKRINLQVYVMIAAILIIMLFFSFMTDGAYLSARNVSNLLRQTAITGILAVGMVTSD